MEDTNIENEKYRMDAYNLPKMGIVKIKYIKKVHMAWKYTFKKIVIRSLLR